MAGLSDLLAGGMPSPPGGNMPPTDSTGLSNLLSAGVAKGSGGLKTLVQGIIAAIIEVLKIVARVYDPQGKEFQDILRAVKTLQSLAGNTTAKDAFSAIQTLISSLPANMQGTSPLSNLIGAGQSPPGMPPGGAPTPQPGAMPPTQ
jgi:hypothetical protein